MLNNIDKENIKHLYNSVPNYIRVLGSNKKGYEILNKIKSDSNINIITKYSDYKNLNDPLINQFLLFEEKATDLFFLGLASERPLVNLDFTNTAYFK